MNPYECLPDKFFWKPSVAAKCMFDIEGLWNPKFEILPTNRIATYGSCFAQHIGQSLANRGFGWLITERPPFGLSAENAKLYNYNVFTSRTGNIYTTSLLKQWTQWALGKRKVPDELWEKDGRYFDPFRPIVEPNAFPDAEELKNSRSQSVKSFKKSIQKADYFVFTLGLTESWVNKQSGYEYPMCPGTVAGEFDPNCHEFRNHKFDAIIGDLMDSIRMMRTENPALKFILTVSPVPLTATMSDQHILVATMSSKSILRAVAGQLASDYPYIDYFPSYEIINSPVFKGAFFEPNQRNVNAYGVNFVMESFFKCLHGKFGGCSTVKPTRAIKNSDEVCEEELLGAFNKTQ